MNRLGSSDGPLPPDRERMAQVEAQLRAREERLAQAQADLADAYRRLEEMDNARAQFVLTLTHELRSPVAAIESLLKSLPYAGDLPPKARDLAERASQRVSALVSLVNDLLDVARERREYGGRAFRPVDLRAVLQNVRTACQARAEARGVALTVESPEVDVRPMGDPEDLERLFLNLVGNAVNYTPEGGRVEVVVRGSSSVAREKDSDRSRVTNHESPGEWVEVAVKDTGIGIPSESLRRLFEEFYRAPNAKRLLAHGTGLGLTICKRIVEAHRGQITVDSEENVGSTFTVRLPLTSDSESAPTGKEPG